MAAETAFVLRYFVAVGTTVRSTVLSVGILQMYTQIIFAYKCTITFNQVNFSPLAHVLMPVKRRQLH
jgi:hypothetical protein